MVHVYRQRVEGIFRRARDGETGPDWRGKGYEFAGHAHVLGIGALRSPAGSQPVRKTAVVNVFEAALAVGRGIQDYRRTSELVRRFLREAAIDMVPPESDCCEIAVDAFACSGCRATHPAKLNACDCLSCAAAQRTGLPMRFKGADFTLRDMRKPDRLSASREHPSFGQRVVARPRLP
ncbi:hypothetical protein EJC49_20665 [Aquibium carbonis]|uniref:PIN domain-containing protein n=1 Tax=Aquibium carbonis TaxID=2495581 RepID=A0A429YST8_9HYPH|nr:type II toxin-antitoxin system VapC family toxin [Aquibium carbonis]RST84517.1 hypothetical protein EJC49_20665 [Aquibium carbonis]